MEEMARAYSWRESCLPERHVAGPRLEWWCSAGDWPSSDGRVAEVLGRELALGDVVYAKRPDRLPVVLTRDEVAMVLAQMRGICRLVAALLYGAGLRLQEAVCPRVKDLDFSGGQLVVRRGKGQKDRAAILPASLRGDLEARLAEVHQNVELDVESQSGVDALPGGDGAGQSLINAPEPELLLGPPL